MILDALQIGCREILLCLGDSAASDGGAGCAAALGVRFLDASGRSFVPVGDTLKNIAHIDLLGPCTGAGRGQTAGAVRCAPHALRRRGRVRAAGCPAWTRGWPTWPPWPRRTWACPSGNCPAAAQPAAWAPARWRFWAASCARATEMLLDLVNFDELLADASLVLTGEGCIDAQTAQGKVVAGVARRARAAGVPVLAFAGILGEGAGQLYELGVTAMQAANRAGLPLEQAAPRAAADLRRAAEDACRLLSCGNGDRRPAARSLKPAFLIHTAADSLPGRAAAFALLSPAPGSAAPDFALCPGKHD